VQASESSKGVVNAWQELIHMSSKPPFSPDDGSECSYQENVLYVVNDTCSTDPGSPSHPISHLSTHWGRTTHFAVNVQYFDG